jgi:hypothetical protein
LRIRGAQAESATVFGARRGLPRISRRRARRRPLGRPTARAWRRSDLRASRGSGCGRGSTNSERDGNDACAYCCEVYPVRDGGSGDAVRRCGDAEGRRGGTEIADCVNTAIRERSGKALCKG